MPETTHEYALRIARGCARGIALADFNEFKKVLRDSFVSELSTWAPSVRREIREAFDAFTSQDFVALFTGSAYRSPTVPAERLASMVEQKLILSRTSVPIGNEKLHTVAVRGPNILGTIFSQDFASEDQAAITCSNVGQLLGILGFSVERHIEGEVFAPATR